MPSGEALASPDEPICLSALDSKENLTGVRVKAGKVKDLNTPLL